MLDSDGITEAVCRETEEMFGEDRLADCVRALVDRDADAILTHVLDAVLRFSGRADTDEDASVLVIKA